MRLIAAMFGASANYNALLAAQGGTGFTGWNDVYDLLETYYYNNDLYRTLGAFAPEDIGENRKTIGLKTSAHRIVEFYASKTFPFSLEYGAPVRADNPNVPGRIEQMWEWSNWETRQPLAGRTHALYGDLYLQTATKGTNPRTRQVYWTQIDVRHITQIKTDFRGYTTYVRIDVPQTAMADDGTETGYYVTDIWDKYAGTFRRWEHSRGGQGRGVHATIAELGRPTYERTMIDAFQIDFIPLTKIPFRDVGLARGMSAFIHILDKQNEANRMATQLVRNMFRWNRPFWIATANETGADALDLLDDEDETLAPEDRRLDLGGEEAISLPGNKKLEPAVPNLNWQAHLDAIAGIMEEIEFDAPELAYSKLRTMNQVSGRAVALLLSDTIDRANEARRNAWGGLVRVHEMGLTMGQVGRIPGFGPERIGTYAQRTFRHRMVGTPVIGATEQEEAETLATRAQAGEAIGRITQRGILTEVLEFTEETADLILGIAAESGGIIPAIVRIAADGNDQALGVLGDAAESTTDTAGGADDVPASAAD